MATTSQWWQGARPRTLPAAVTPVAAGTGVAAYTDDVSIGLALLCLVVALSLQIGVNYANDYSDGIRGTDDKRQGPLRLTASGLAAASHVKTAAFSAFGIGAVTGLALITITQQWWLLAVGAAALMAAWYYTGGSRPYGYRGLGEVSVFLFFGVVATAGTAYVQSEELTTLVWLTSVGVGALACALLVVNNLRDIPTDEVSGKRTLAVRIGDTNTRVLYVLLVDVALVVVIAIAISWTEWALIALAAFIVALPPIGAIANRAVGRDLIPVLVATGQCQLLYGVLLGAGLALA